MKISIKPETKQKLKTARIVFVVLLLLFLPIKSSYEVCLGHRHAKVEVYKSLTYAVVTEGGDYSIHFFPDTVFSSKHIVEMFYGDNIVR